VNSDPRAFQSVIYVLGAALLIDLLSIALLTHDRAPLPDVLAGAVPTILVALAALLARTPGSKEPQPVVVQQPDDAPVPVAESPVVPELTPEPEPKGSRKVLTMHAEPSSRRDPYGLDAL
jgi:hypothetical protein